MLIWSNIVNIPNLFHKENDYILIISVLVTFINAWSVDLATKVQNFFTVMKLIAVAIIVVGGAYQLCQGKLITYYLKLNCFYLIYESITSNAIYCKPIKMYSDIKLVSESSMGTGGI